MNQENQGLEKEINKAIMDLKAIGAFFKEDFYKEALSLAKQRSKEFLEKYGIDDKATCEKGFNSLLDHLFEKLKDSKIESLNENETDKLINYVAKKIRNDPFGNEIILDIIEQCIFESDVIDDIVIPLIEREIKKDNFDEYNAFNIIKLITDSFNIKEEK
ncbi:hypothetical protein DMB95_08950 [Campylobacter sp. MIT 12-8780]|uniref:hypothetical protein n=1 Tax=unclassified Campylobacter TaxID=2593542 RepID=UPI00115F5EEA|nr:MULTISPECIES: hypothetical protein [unclassified Campylobacter]NDJ27920.1 hypothetical protein [Campylobacter sp. MIT 19-121]TQR40147.1 hypothetical protein DMB95_08950 [Campylobacter sp. MIT 12-8780]